MLLTNVNEIQEIQCVICFDDACQELKKEVSGLRPNGHVFDTRFITFIITIVQQSDKAVGDIWRVFL